MRNFALRCTRRNKAGTIFHSKRYLSSLRDDRGMEFSSSKLYGCGSNMLEDTVASMNDAVEAFAARSGLFYGDSREKFLELLLVDQEGELADKKYDLQQNPIALCGLGLSAYFQTSHFAHDGNLALWNDFGGVANCISNAHQLSFRGRDNKDEASTLPPLLEIEKLHLEAFHNTVYGNVALAAKIYEHILRSVNATDLIAIRALHEIYSSMGDVYNRKTFITRILPYWNHTVPGYASLMSMHADALAEAGNYAEAEDAAMRSLSMESSKSEMSIGTVCKCYLANSKPREGLRFLREVEEQWDNADAIPRSFAWWRALFYLEQGNDDLALHQIDVNYGTSESRDGRPIVLEDFVSSTFIFWLLYLRQVDIFERLSSFSENYINLILFSPHNEAVLAGESNSKFRIQLSLAMLSVMLGNENWLELLHDKSRGESVGDFFYANPHLKPNHDAYNSIVPLSMYTNKSELDPKVVAETGQNILKGLKACKDNNADEFLKIMLPLRRHFQHGGGDFRLSIQDEDVLQQTILEFASRQKDTELSRALFAQRSFERPHSPYVWVQYSKILTAGGEEDAGRAAYAYAQNMGWGQKGFGAH